MIYLTPSVKIAKAILTAPFQGAQERRISTQTSIFKQNFPCLPCAASGISTTSSFYCASL